MRSAARSAVPLVPVPISGAAAPAAATPAPGSPAPVRGAVPLFVLDILGVFEVGVDFVDGSGPGGVIFVGGGDVGARGGRIAPYIRWVHLMRV